MTDMTDFQREISRLLPDVKTVFYEPMSKHTSFRIGGPAEVMAFPENTDQLSQILKVSALLDIKPAIIGAGTNILAPDEGIAGLTICLKENFSSVNLVGTSCIRAEAGATLTKVAVFAANAGLSGLEFAHGIPGSVGGGVYMNAGAYGGEMKDVLVCAEVMDYNGSVHKYGVEELGLSYRHSILEECPAIVLSAQFQLVSKPVQEIRDYMQELAAKRKASQPLDKPSAGSAFKRPAGGYAAALIDQAGLRGYCVGGAAISEKHAGFAVNMGGATAEDVKKLLHQVSKIVYEKSGILLEPEIRIW